MSTRVGSSNANGQVHALIYYFILSLPPPPPRSLLHLRRTWRRARSDSHGDGTVIIPPDRVLERWQMGFKKRAYRKVRVHRIAPEKKISTEKLP